MLEAIVIEIIANIVFLALTIIIGWSGFLLLRRRRLLSFFELEKSKRISIYLSNLQIIKNGSIGTDGKPGLYNGTAVVFNEVTRAIELRNMFSYQIPGLNQQPGFLKYLLVADIDQMIQAAPQIEDDIDTASTLITFGSPAYNVVSKWVEDKLLPPMKFCIHPWSIEIDGVPPIRHLRQAFIQRVYDPLNKRMVFYIAGLSEIGTVGAIHFLMTKWPTLRRMYGDSIPFSILIEVDSMNYQQHKIVMQKSVNLI